MIGKPGWDFFGLLPKRAAKMNLSFEGNHLTIDGQVIEVALPIRDARRYGDQIIVLYDLDPLIKDPVYREMERNGAPPIHNLVALSRDGFVVWEAEFPSNPDYYYQIVSLKPLIASTFSSYDCEINPLNGKILRTTFYK